MVAAPTYTMLSDASFRSFVDVAERLGVVLPGDIKRGAPPSVKLRTGAEVLFRSADEPDRLRGPNLSGWWLDEASLMRKEAFDILVGRLREGGEVGWGTATFTPKGKLHWTYKKFGPGPDGRPPEDTDLIHAESSENVFLPADFVKTVRRQYSAKQADQELGGQFVDAGGNHYFPDLWPRYVDVGDAYRVLVGGAWVHTLKRDCSRLLSLDWAMGKPDKRTGELSGDCTAFVVADLLEDGSLFPLDAVSKRVPLSGNAPLLAEMCRKWQPVVVAGDDDNLTEALLLECRRYRDIPEIKTLPLRSKNKLVRSQAAIVRAERGMVYLPQREAPWVEVLVNQLASFTGLEGEEDDLADCFSILGRLADEFRPCEDLPFEEPLLGSVGYVGGWM